MAEAAAAPFEARYSVIKMLVWTLLAGIMTAGALGMLLPALEQGSLGGGVIGGFGLVVFGGALLGFLRCAVDRRVQLRIDGKGMYLRPHSDQTIPLRSIRGVEVAPGQVKVRLYKPSKYPIQSWLRRFIFRINGSASREYFGDAWVWTAHYDCTWQQIMDAINVHTVPTEFERQLAERMKAGHE